MLAPQIGLLFTLLLSPQCLCDAAECPVTWCVLQQNRELGVVDGNIVGAGNEFVWMTCERPRALSDDGLPMSGVLLPYPLSRARVHRVHRGYIKGEVDKRGAL